jgi:hypothetical protein
MYPIVCEYLRNALRRFHPWRLRQRVRSRHRRSQILRQGGGPLLLHVAAEAGVQASEEDKIADALIAAAATYRLRGVGPQIVWCHNFECFLQLKETSVPDPDLIRFLLTLDTGWENNQDPDPG